MVRYQTHSAKPFIKTRNKISNGPLVYNDKSLRMRIFSYMNPWKCVEKWDNTMSRLYYTKQHIHHAVSLMNQMNGGDKLTKHAKIDKYFDLIGNTPENGIKTWITKTGKKRKMCNCELNVPKILILCPENTNNKRISDSYHGWILKQSSYIKYLKNINGEVLILKKNYRTDMINIIKKQNIYSFKMNNLYDMQFIEKYHIISKNNKKLNFFDTIKSPNKNIINIKYNKCPKQIIRKNNINKSIISKRYFCKKIFINNRYIYRRIQHSILISSLLHSSDLLRIKYSSICFTSKMSVKKYKKLSNEKYKLFVQYKSIRKKLIKNLPEYTTIYKYYNKFP